MCAHDISNIGGLIQRSQQSQIALYLHKATGGLTLIILIQELVVDTLQLGSRQHGE